MSGLAIHAKVLIFVAVDNISAAQFDERVVGESARRPVLVDFWATWCQPCTMLAPILEQLAGEYGDRLAMVKVDIDREPQLAARFAIRSVPTVILFAGGAAVTQFSGVLPADAVRHMLEPFLPRASDELVGKARAALGDGNAQQACALLRQALAEDPINYRIHPELGNALLQAGELDELETLLRGLPTNVAQEDAYRLLYARLAFARAAGDAPPLSDLERQVTEDSENLDARFALAARQVLAERYEPAMENLLRVIRQDRRYRDDGGRRAMVDVFALLNNEGPLVKKYRGLLAGAIN
ncbi:MAG: thioredoxin [Gammaproteobacteria bacterium]|nr:thioredoxin [Gammaproteobacteria bacterium]